MVRMGADNIHPSGRITFPTLARERRGAESICLYNESDTP